MSKLKTTEIKGWNEFLKIKEKFKKTWLFRGQLNHGSLKTSLDRDCAFFGVSQLKRQKIEHSRYLSLMRLGLGFSGLRAKPSCGFQHHYQQFSSASEKGDV